MEQVSVVIVILVLLSLNVYF